MLGEDERGKQVLPLILTFVPIFLFNNLLGFIFIQ